jgi:ABC-2 type transport system permease protein
MFTSVYGVVVAVFIGVMSVAEERRNHSLNIILSKPLYRRDLIAGKLVGLNSYMLTIIIYSMFLAALALSMFYFTPADPLDFALKVAIYMVIAAVYMFLSISIAMLISAVFKDLLISASVAMAYIYVDGYVGWDWISPALSNFSPNSAMCRLYINQATDLQNTALTVGQWFDANAANLFFLIAAVLLVSLAAMVLSSRSDDV